MQRRNFLRTVCGSVIAAVMVPVAKLFPSSGLVHVPSEDAFTKGLWNFRQKKHEDDRAILDSISASLSGSGSPMPKPGSSLTLSEMVEDLRKLADSLEQQIVTGVISADTPMGWHKQWNWKRRVVVKIEPAIPANENEAAEYIA